MFSSLATDPQTSDSARSVSNDALRDAVIELIHAVNSVLNEELSQPSAACNGPRHYCT